MATESEPGSSPWHAGESRLQQRLGVAERMAVFGRKVIRDFMPDQHRAFYGQLPFLLVGVVDADGKPWATVLEGQPAASFRRRSAGRGRRGSRWSQR